jgi:hypothetical protein
MSHSVRESAKEVGMPRTLTMFFPDGRTEYWLTALVFEPGDKLKRNGATWIVTSVGSPERDGERRHTTITVRARTPLDVSNSQAWRA